MILKNKTFNTALFYIIVITFVLVSCTTPSTDQGTLSEKPRSILIFVDKSASVNFNQQEVKAKTNKILKDGVNQLNNPFDQVKLLLIHEKTTSISPDASYKVPKFSCAPNLPPMAIKKERNAYSLEIIRNKKDILATAEKLFATAPDPQNKKGTDIIGILEVISRLENKDDLKDVYLFTDGVQSSNDFVVNPKNKIEAEGLAVKHAQQSRDKMKLKPEVLNLAAVHIILPYTANSTRLDSNLRYYWDKLFGEFGMTTEFL
jgi:hypothetical protein